MYFISSVGITGFWGDSEAHVNLNRDTSIFIGPNGTGKTTFIEILRATLTVDLAELVHLEFEETTIVLRSDKGQSRTLRIKKGSLEHRFVPFEFQISKKKFKVKWISSQDHDRFPRSYLHRFEYAADEVKSEIAKLIQVSSLSVYRAESDRVYTRDAEYSIPSQKSSVDVALRQRMQRFKNYRMRIFEKQSEIQRNLRQNVLLSLIDSDIQDSYQLDTFELNEDRELERITSAYRRLGIPQGKVKARAKKYMRSVTKKLKEISGFLEEARNDLSSKQLEDFPKVVSEFIGERFRIIQDVTQRSLDSDQEIQLLYEPLERYEETVNQFLLDKQIKIQDSELIIESTSGKKNIDPMLLSSGEKQLLILLTEAFLQDKIPCAFITDEPELSLHISWQRELLSSVQNLNPNAQIIVATHSPEIASGYQDKLFDMREVINVEA